MAVSDSPFEAIAEAVIAVFNNEFADEQFVMIPDELYESLGKDRVDVGIAPLEDVLKAGNDLVQETWVEVKFYDLWTQEISPDTQVSPYRIASFAERFRSALRRARFTMPSTGEMWYFDVRRIQYPRDPTGNKTRFVATIRAFGNNAGLVETSA